MRIFAVFFFIKKSSKFPLVMLSGPEDVKLPHKIFIAKTNQFFQILN